jgi:hypothetical protein
LYLILGQVSWKKKPAKPMTERAKPDVTGLLFGVNEGAILGLEGNSENSAYNDVFPPGRK